MSDKVAELEECLAKIGPSSIRFTASVTSLSSAEIYTIVRLHPDKFDIVGVCGSVGSYCVSLVDKERPIQLVVNE